MPECPYCGKWFKTKRGLQQHIAKVHKEKTPFGDILDPTTFDPIEKMEREAKRASRRKKKKRFGLF